MKIFTLIERAQLLLTILRSAGERATLLSIAHERNEAIIVAASIPVSVEESVIKLATTIEE